MTARSILSDDETQMIKGRIEAARSDRAHFAPTYNLYYDLARPWRPRVNKQVATNTPQSPSDQDDIFDSTLQDCADDYASDMNAEHTPMYKPWTTHRPTSDIQGKDAKDQVKSYVDKRMGMLYDRIRNSNFEEASQEMWIDLGIAPSGLMIGYAPPGKPIPVEHVPTSELLILPGPFGGVDDRWRERAIPVRHLDTLWPDLDWSDYGPTKFDRMKSRTTAIVIQGGFRDWSKENETWHWHVVCKNKVLRRKTYTGSGSCPMVVVRTNVSSPTAYGVGPAGKALAPARTLNELNYLYLKMTGRILDPAVVFYDDGLLNPEGGIDNGTWLPAGENFKIQELRPDGSVRDGWFTQEDLRMMVKRAMYQEKPFQRGDTPPTASQWLGEEKESEQRKAFPRARIHAELVLPAIRRFEWIMMKRGEIEPLQIEGSIVNIEPVSPLSRSADIEEAQLALQFLQGIGGTMPESLGRIDESATLTNIKEKIGAGLVEVLGDKEYEAKLQQRAQAEQAAQPPQ